jgi:bifunctional non-homologous end joining protein LigD
MAAVAAKELPQGAEWTYEVKWDGYRALVIKHGAQVRILSRNNKDLTPMYPGVAAAGLRIKAEQAVIDGEIVALDASGRPSFQVLQNRSSHPQHLIVFYAFDVVSVDGRELTGEPIETRRAMLSRIIEQDATLRISSPLPGTASEVLDAVRSLGLEGVVAKRNGSLYRPGERSSDWVKLRLENQHEFVIGGYRPDGAASIDALIVGYYDRKGLKFAGKVRAGFTPHVRRELAAQCKPLEMDDCPFIDLPTTGPSRWGGGVTADQMHEMRWIRPRLVAQVRFAEWTAEGHLRHAAFLGLRSDKRAREVVREGTGARAATGSHAR